MTFFYDLNKKLDEIRATPSKTHGQLNEQSTPVSQPKSQLTQALNERDMGKHNNATTGFKALAKKAGGGEKGEKIAGAQFQKMKKAGQLEEEEGMSRAAKGYEKYGKEGMEALAKAGRDGKSLDPIRKKYDKYDNTVEESLKDKAKLVGHLAKDMARKGLEKLGGGSDADQIRDLQRKMGVPQTGKKPGATEDYGPMEAGAPMTGKQKSFAKLAPPTDKITFADKIAGAKKEVDERIGDVAAEAIKNALSPKQKKIDMNKNGKLDANDFAMLRKGGKQETDEGWDDMVKDVHARAAKPKIGHVERGHKHDIEHTATGRKVTRRVDDQGNSVGADDASDAQPAKRGRGRPAGTGSKMGAKGPSGKSKLMTKENDFDPAEKGEYDQEGDMAKDSIKTVVRHAQALEKILGDNDNLPEWVQSKLAKIESMMTAVDDYMQNQEGDDEEMAVGEESTNKRDNRAEKAGKKVTKDIEYDEKKKDGIHGKKRGSEDEKAEKAGKKVAKDIEYDEKKDKEDKPKKVKEQGGAETPTASSGFSFGKGIYDSMNRELEKMIAESMQSEAAPRVVQRVADRVGTYGGAALGAVSGGLLGGLMAGAAFGPIGLWPGAGVGGLAGFKAGVETGGPMATSAVNSAHDAGVGLYRKISSVLGGPEGTIEFVKAHIEAALRNKESFEFKGKNYTTTMKYNDAAKLERQMNSENMSESMSVNMSDSTEGGKSLTITATDEDALKLADLLKNAGLGGGAPMSQEMGHGDEHGHSEEPCPSCGMSDCGCGDVHEALDENNPDWPTDTETSNDALQYSGGLNGPKSTGQTTIPVIASQEDRQHTYEEDQALRRMMEMAGVQQDNLKPWEQTMKEEAEEEELDEAAKCSACDCDPCECDESVTESFEQMLSRMRDIAGIKEAKKPDFLDMDKDGDKKEPMKKAVADKEKKVEESIFALTNQWKAYKG
jgi:hypothetical protein